MNSEHKGCREEEKGAGGSQRRIWSYEDSFLKMGDTEEVYVLVEMIQ